MNINIAQKISMLLTHRLYRTAVLMALLVVMAVVAGAVNKAQGIDNGPEPPPVADYGISVSPESASIAGSGTANFAVSATCSIGGNPCQINLAASVNPATGMSVSLGQTSGNGLLTTTATVTASASAAPGAYTLTVYNGTASASARITICGGRGATEAVFDACTSGGAPTDCVATDTGTLPPGCRYNFPVGNATTWSGATGPDLGGRIDGADVNMVIRGPYRYTYLYCTEYREPGFPMNIPSRAYAQQCISWETRTANIPISVEFGNSARILRALAVENSSQVVGSSITIRADEITVRSGAVLSANGLGFAGGYGGRGGGTDGGCGYSDPTMPGAHDNPPKDDCKRDNGNWYDGPYEFGGGEGGGGFTWSGPKGSGQGGGYGGNGGQGWGNYAGGSGGSRALGRTYGDAWLSTLYKGSGGGGGGSANGADGGYGGAGGGAIGLTVGRLIIESGAMVAANGQNGFGGRVGFTGGAANGAGGAGGSIRINLGTSITVGGEVLARGGQGVSPIPGSCFIFSTCYTVESGGGGGGRIVVLGPGVPQYFDDGTRGGVYSGLGGSISVRGGLPGSGGAQPGGNGTICIGRSPADCGAPLFDFTLSASDNITVVQGSSGSNNITATLATGTPETVTLSISGLPAGATAAFSQPSGQPTFTSGLTINTAASTPVGTYLITVTGTASSMTRNTTFNLIVTYINRPPSAINLQVSQPNYCAVSWSAATFSWQFTDPDPGDSQSAYQMQVDNNSDFSSPEVNTGKVLSSSNSYATLSGALSWNTTYYWRLMVWDSKDLSSSWISGPFFTTPKHAYPTIDFSWAPQNPSVGENTQFTDLSTVYGGSTKSSWFWTFQDGNPANSTQQNPLVKFLSTGAKLVTLRVTDSDGFNCPGQKTLNALLRLPEYKEVPPVIWLKNFFAGVVNFFNGFLKN